MSKETNREEEEYLDKSGTRHLDIGVYNPKVTYSMVSMGRNENPAWLRSPFVTKWELQGILRHYVENYSDYSDLEIFKEETLDITGKFECTDGVKREMTLREYLFGHMYQNSAECVRKTPSFLGGFKPNFDKRSLKDVE